MAYITRPLTVAPVDVDLCISFLIDDIRMRYQHDPRGLPQAAFDAIYKQLGLPHDGDGGVNYSNLKALLMTAHTPTFTIEESLWIIIVPRQYKRYDAWRILNGDWVRVAVRGKHSQQWLTCDHSGPVRTMLADEFDAQLANLPAFDWELYHNDDD
jgi:hypothetical protein